MTMRDYRNLAWQNHQPWERNPNPPRSMRDYRDQWRSASSYMVPLQYTSTPLPPQPPQLISPVDQAILNTSKLVDNFIEEQRAVTVQANQEINTVESSMNKKLDGFQSEIDQKLDILQESISELTNQLVLQEKENPEGGCLTGTMVEEQCQQQGLSESSYTCAVVCPWEKEEEITALLTEESSGQETMEGTQEPIIQPNSIDLDLNATA